VIEPRRERRPIEHAAHERRLAETWRDEIAGGDLGVERAVDVLRVPLRRGLDNAAAERKVVQRVARIERERQHERRVRLAARADRTIEILQIRHELLRKILRQRSDVGGPLGGLLIVPRLQLGAEREQPDVAVRPLERPSILEVSDLAIQIGLAKMIRQLLADQPVHGNLRLALQHRRQRPRRVDRGVPVAATVERANLVVAINRPERRVPEVWTVRRTRLQLVEARERLRHEPLRARVVQCGRDHRRQGVNERIDARKRRG
jgi:hypothetical protein